ncbi:hypothetical protein A4A49_63639, partial [Nicotiana attenuata]
IDINVVWNKPRGNSLKLNTDGSFILKNSLCGIGGVIRNNNGHWLVGFQEVVPCFSSVHAELLALKQGLYVARMQGLSNIEVKMDSTDAINCLENGMPFLNDIIFECRSLIMQLKVQTISHTFREGNKLAHRMAREALSNVKCRDLTILYYPPLFVNEVLQSDVEGITYVTKKLSKDVCYRLAHFENKNVLRDIVCNSQVVNTLSGDYDCMNTTI